MDTGVLHRAIDELAGQDLSELCDAEVHELTIGLARAGGRIDGVLFSALDIWDARGIWSDDGSKSPAARLAREANWSPREASMAIRRARNLRRLPATAAAVTAGDLSAEFVDLVHRASQVDLDVPFGECETAIVEGCVEAGYAESKDAIGRWAMRPTPTTSSRATSVLHTSDVAMRWRRWRAAQPASTRPRRRQASRPGSWCRS
jgi:hypothetical protein